MSSRIDKNNQEGREGGNYVVEERRQAFYPSPTAALGTRKHAPITFRGML